MWLALENPLGHSIRNTELKVSLLPGWLPSTKDRQAQTEHPESPALKAHALWSQVGLSPLEALQHFTGLSVHLPVLDFSVQMSLCQN